jgi:hypothetical protein
MPINKPLNVFISYSNNKTDRDQLVKLVKMIRPLVNQKKIKIWDDSLILAGEKWDKAVKENLNFADIVLLLLSSDFLASTYIYEVELNMIFDSEKKQECKVVPILLSDCQWKLDNRIFETAIIPKVKTSSQLLSIDKWDRENEAFFEVSEALIKLISDIQDGKEPLQPRITQHDDVDSTKPWTTFFSNHHFKKSLEIAPIMSVNSDRDEHYKKQLQQHFKKHKNKQENLVYFISACPKQKPASIAKRLVYFFDEDFTDYIRHDKYQNEMRTVDLKLKSSEEGTWKVFWQTFQQDFLKEDIDYERFISNPSNWLDKQNRIALAFKIEENIWTDVGDVQDHLQFILEKFEVLPPKHRKFVFFFICRFPDVHTHRSGDCQCHLDCLDKLILPKEVAAEEFHKLHIHRLDAVREDDVRVWANSILDSAHVDTLINELRKKLPDKSSALYDMSMIQEMQYAAYSRLRDSK